jgi:hypothetical protein
MKDFALFFRIIFESVRVGNKDWGGGKNSARITCIKMPNSPLAYRKALAQKKTTP